MLREEANIIINNSLKAVLPDEAVRDALIGKEFPSGKLVLVAVGKAAWQMAREAVRILGNRVNNGIVITKYGHVKGCIEGVKCIEAGHPVPDDNTFSGTEEILDMVGKLNNTDTVLFLLSGGGSALFEKPLIAADELQSLTNQLLASGANISEINTIRKRVSAVKGGRFAKLIEPASIYSVILSDIPGSPLDMIASGPAYPDSSTSEEALHIIKKYNIKLSRNAINTIKHETPKDLKNVDYTVSGGVEKLCEAVAKETQKMGYRTSVITTRLAGEAKTAGIFLADLAKKYQNTTESFAFIAGGETVVHLTGSGKGGRNQELVLAAVHGIAGFQNTAVFSFGSDGTDGPTDAAGAFADGDTFSKLIKQGIDIKGELMENNSYYALDSVGALIKTGPTGTNVNDVAVVLIKRGFKQGHNTK